jgi:hypothetical protein
MATINLGAIKFNWKGAYNSSTTYAVDDVVSSGGNSYVCIQAHSNQAVGNATAYWNIMSSAGTNGTNGTDIGTTLTTQGDILYRDGSGLQRLPKGTAGQVLQMNSGATAPEYGTLSSDFVHIKTQTVSSNVNNVQFVHGSNGVIFDNTYKFYKILFTNVITNTGTAQMRMRFGAGDFTVRTSGYKSTGYRVYYNDAGSQGASQATTADSLYLCNVDSNTNLATGHMSAEINIYDPSNSGTKTQYFSNVSGSDSSHIIAQYSGGYYNTAEATSGVSFYNMSNSIANGIFSLYGIKN